MLEQSTVSIGSIYMCYIKLHSNSFPREERHIKSQGVNSLQLQYLQYSNAYVVNQQYYKKLDR